MLKKIRHVSNGGFTLIELVAVIIILGILAAAAMPRFASLSTDAGNASTISIAAAINSATSLNYAAKLVGNASAINMSTMANVCTNALAQQLVYGNTTFKENPANGVEFSVTGNATCQGATDAGKVVDCTITGFAGVSQPLKIICSG